MKCEYGCGQEAKFPPRKGMSKWCCSEHYQTCPAVKTAPWNKGKTDVYSKKTLKKMSESHVGQTPWCKDKKLTEEHKENLSQSRNEYFALEYYRKKYPTFMKVEELVEDENTKKLKVRCKNHKCKNSKKMGGWFYPTREQLKRRIDAIEHDDGNDGCFLYCSDECKYTCMMYGRTINQLMQEQKEINYTNEEYQIYRKQVLKRENYLCEYCGEKATTIHHSRPQKLEPFFTLDPDYGIACCQNCHYKYGHKKDSKCSTGKLAAQKCE